MKLALVAVLGTLLAAGDLRAQCNKKPHERHANVIWNGRNLSPAPGYAWVDATAGDFRVVWRPGSAYYCGGELGWPNLLAAPTEREWYPAPGYTWARVDANGKPSPGQLSVKWTEGLAYFYLGERRFPNVVSSSVEDVWYPQPGYAWVEVDANGRPAPGDLRVYWKPGSSYRVYGVTKWPNIEASGTDEGKWWPAPGYVWANTDAQGMPLDLSVRWLPGIRFRYLGTDAWANIQSSETEGSWIPSPGYGWANRDDNGRPIPGEFAVLTIAMLDRWSRYLHEIQRDNAYPNWSSPPYDVHLARGGRPVSR